MRDINLKIEDFHSLIKNFLISSELPIGIIYYIFKDIYNEVEQQYYSGLNMLTLKLQEEKNEEKTSSISLD